MVRSGGRNPESSCTSKSATKCNDSDLRPRNRISHNCFHFCLTMRCGTAGAGVSAETGWRVKVTQSLADSGAPAVVQPHLVRPWFGVVGHDFGIKKTFVRSCALNSERIFSTHGLSVSLHVRVTAVFCSRSGRQSRKHSSEARMTSSLV